MGDHNLPAPTTPLVGRARELAELRERVLRPGIRLLTLTGAGGTGKTRLALAVAAAVVDAFDDGVWLVDLAALHDPARVVPAIAQALRVKERAGEPLPAALGAFMRDRRLLLLLDNFEQVVDAAPGVAALLERSAGTKLLVTSRTPLHVYGEHQYQVPPLALPDPGRAPSPEAASESEAVALFLQRAHAAQAGFRASPADLAAIAAICARLDGLPLAIELAAARVRVMPPPALLARLDRRLPLLTGGARNLPARQQTLRAAIDWSHELLDESERRLFSRLAVFVGGCTLEAAEAVCQPLPGSLARDPAAVVDALASLVDKSLLERRVGLAGEPRFAMLETIREYAAERLESSGEADHVRSAHAAAFLAMVERAEPELTGPRQAAWLAQLDADHENLRAALAWAFAPGPTHPPPRAPTTEPADRLLGAPAADAAPSRPPSPSSSPSPDPTSPADTPASSSRTSPLENPGVQGRSPESSTTNPVELALRLSGALWRFWIVRGHLSEGLSWLERALAAGHEASAAARAKAANAAGNLSRLRGDWAAATAWHEQSLALRRELGDAFGIASSLVNLGNLALDQADHERAAALYGEGLAIHRATAHRWGTALALNNLGVALRELGRHDEAGALLDESLALRQELGDQYGVAETLENLGRLALRRGDHREAASLACRSLSLWRELGDRLSTARLVDDLAFAAAAAGDRARAARLWGAAERLRATLGLPRPLHHRERHAAAVAAARSRLGEAPFAEAWAAGAAMSADEAVAYALLADQPPAPRRGAPADPLTAREREVAGLIARGLTSKEIAAELIVSEKTVDAHADHIRRKLGLRSRAEIAAWAALRLGAPAV